MTGKLDLVLGTTLWEENRVGVAKSEVYKGQTGASKAMGCDECNREWWGWWEIHAAWVSSCPLLRSGNGVRFSDFPGEDGNLDF